MKFAFVTCVTLGKSVLEEIYNLGGSFEFLVTLKDELAKNKSGRVYLDDIAEKHNVELLKINNINDLEVVEYIKKYKIDWLFIIGWSQIAREEVLNTPVKGCIGMHPTLLPEGRGRASIPWAIIKNLDKTGVTMFRLDTGVDTGDILGQIEIPLYPEITATDLYEDVNEKHIMLIKKYWDDIVSDSICIKKQDNSIASEWPGRQPEDGQIYESMSWAEAERLVRALTDPYPGAFYYNKDGNRIIVRSATLSNNPGENSFNLKDGYLIPTEYEVEKK